VREGFRNWQKALTPQHGLPRHEDSTCHQEALQSWRTFEAAKHSNLTIDISVTSKQFEKHFYYVQSIIEIIQLLAVNELPLRGTWDSERNEEGGLFSVLFNHWLKKDSQLAKVAMSVPQNAKYTSPQIQNEVIQIMWEVTLEKILEEAKNSQFFSVMADETRDKQGMEDLSVAIRYLNSDFEVRERCVGIVGLMSQNAETISSEIIKILQSVGLDCKRLLSQSYDGASTMSGYRSGVQKRISLLLEMNVPYVHDYNHRLHLVIIDTISSISEIREIFEMCRMLYDFCKLLEVSKHYFGEALKRLLDHRWTGHYDSLKTIVKSSTELETTFAYLANSALNAETKVKAKGYLATISEPQFKFLSKFALSLLAVAKPISDALQSRSIDVQKASMLIDSLKTEVFKLRSVECLGLEEFFPPESSEISEEDSNLLESGLDKTKPSLRTKKRPRYLDQYIVTENICEKNDISINDNMTRIAFECIDKLNVELENRFSTSNLDLLNAINNLCSRDRCVTKLTSLIKLATDRNCTLDLDALGVELQHFTNIVSSEMTLSAVGTEFQKLSSIFPNMCTLVNISLTVPSGSVVVENSFSCLTRLLRPQRLSMSHERKVFLTLLAFNKDVLQNISMEDLVERFKIKCHRKLFF
jgi:galactitol-specific phosphotransferase system IIB component